MLRILQCGAVNPLLWSQGLPFLCAGEEQTSWLREGFECNGSVIQQGCVCAQGGWRRETQEDSFASPELELSFSIWYVWKPWSHQSVCLSILVAGAVSSQE